MTDDPAANRSGYRAKAAAWLPYSKTGEGSVWTLLSDDADLSCLRDEPAALAHARQAMMFAISPAACGHTRALRRPEAQQRQECGKAEQGHQHNGDKSTQDEMEASPGFCTVSTTLSLMTWSWHIRR